MPGTRDYYRLLHVDPDAPVEIIRASYRTLMQRLKKHPDLGGDQKSAALINEAYAVLTDPARRAAYDRARGRSTPAPGGRHPHQPQAGACSFCGAPHKPARSLQPEDACSNCSSPLYPAEHLRLDASDQRLVERIPRESPVSWYAEWPQSTAHRGTMRDLSLNGMQMTAMVNLEPGRVLKIDTAQCRSVARVAWCTAQDGAWLIGLEFVTLRFHRPRGSFVSAEV